MAVSGDPGDSLTLALEALEQGLQRRVAEQVRLALAIEVKALQGWAPAEIRVQLNLTSDQFRRLRQWLREELDANHADQG